jgi:hypothetical protein
MNSPRREKVIFWMISGMVIVDSGLTGLISLSVRTDPLGVGEIIRGLATAGTAAAYWK